MALGLVAVAAVHVDKPSRPEVSARFRVNPRSAVSVEV